ncbi:MAG: hypothetical protein GY928_17635 [Colwellia sp.]|nr:hypothetical protein [Colwellia sp.]
MYRQTCEILEALQEGKTTVKTCRNQLSKYRGKEDVDTALMFLSAIELFKFYKDTEKTPLKYR